MRDSLGFAVVGAGWFGLKRLSALSKIEDARIEWVVDLDRVRCGPIAKSYSARFTKDPADAFSDSKVDCVLICTPNKSHPLLAANALRDAKHVLVEKPIARNVKEARMMVEAAKKSRSFLKAGSNHRYFPNVKKALDLIREEQIGEPIFFRGSIGHDGELLKGRWFWDADQAGGGTFLDNGVHLLDISRMVFGDFSECRGVIRTDFWPVAPLEDNGFALFVNPKGTALIQSSWTEWYGYMYFEVYGDKGFVIVDSRRATKTIHGLRSSDHTTVYDYSELPPRSHELEIREFMDNVRKGVQPRPSGEDGLELVRMVEAVYRSSRQGRMIRF